MAVRIVETGYIPRPLQMFLHHTVKRFNAIVCHRRFGKTVWGLNETIDRALRNDLKNPQYAYIAPTYGQAKRVAWDYLKEYTKNIAGSVPNESELTITITRPGKGDKIKIMLLGAENPGTLRGIYLDGCILDEFAEMDPTVWSQVVRPSLSDRLGWVIFIGTPKGQNHFYEIYHSAKDDPSWFTAVYKASETGIIPESELALAKTSMSNEEFEQEYECSFTAALIGAYYAKEMDGADKAQRICSVPYDPSCLVYTAWDLGIDDTTVIWFIQQVGREFHAIDYFEDSGRGLDYYAKILAQKEYAYADHFLPHDAGARELGTGKTREETLRPLLRKRPIIVPRMDVDDGINASRMILPRFWFDAKKCDKGIQSLKSYERKWDSKNKIFSSKPLHNWASHGADAFRTFATGIKEDQSDSRKQLPKQTNSKYDLFTRKRSR